MPYFCRECTFECTGKESADIHRENSGHKVTNRP